MRKTSIMMGLALALSLGGAAAASAQAATRTQPARGATQDSSVRRGRGGAEGLLLRGITLSADQKTRVAALGGRNRAEFDAMRAKAKENRSAQTRQRGDTTGFGALRAQMQQRREQRIVELRSILTAQQRTQFDKNVADLKTRAAKHEHKAGFDGKEHGRRSGDADLSR
jgi:Spy/CpxP family protein refolding chaperone